MFREFFLRHLSNPKIPEFLNPSISHSKGRAIRPGEDFIMHRRTVHDTPMGKNVMRRLALIIFRFTGWKPAGKRPDIPKYVIIAAPHTSNWDFLYTICLAFIPEIRLPSS